jgi:PAS domain S-box-containing protein
VSTGPDPKLVTEPVGVAPGIPGSSDVDAREIRGALTTVLGWRSAPALAVSQHDAALVESNRPGAEEGFTPSRAFEFGGLSLRLVTESLSDDAPEREIPAIVIDTMLKSIVEAHFAVWYVWHVPTGTMIVPGMRELLGIPDEAVPTIVEEWFARVHPHDLPRMVAENDEALRANSAFRSEYRLRRGDGGYIAISDWGIVLSGEDGTAEWMAGGLRDITPENTLAQAREESAQLREVLFEKALMPAFLIDGNGVLVDASRSALGLLHAARDGLVGRPAAAILPDDLVAWTKRSDPSDATREDAPEATEIELDVAGTRKWLLATVVPFVVGHEQMALVLGADVTERRRAVEALAESETSLREKTRDLERHNVALQVLMEQRRSGLEESRRVLAENIEHLVLPTLDRLAVAFSDRPEAALLEVVKQTLEEVTSPLLGTSGARLDHSQALTRREYEVLQLVRAGKTTEDIAGALYLSPTTVTFHRGNIRRKLGLHGTGISLSRVAFHTVTTPPEVPVAGGDPDLERNPYKPNVAALLDLVEKESRARNGPGSRPLTTKREPRSRPSTP